MQAIVSSTITDDLMAIKAHLTTRPKHTPGNLVTDVSWHAIRELYHVSQSSLGVYDPLLIPLLQQNVLHWEHVDPPWELPDYVGDLAQALQVTGAWIASGRVVKQEVVAPPPDSPSTLHSQQWQI